MKPSSFILLLTLLMSGCATDMESHQMGGAQLGAKQAEYYTSMVMSLRNCPIDGIVMMGVTGLGNHDVVEKIIKVGTPIIPYLIRALDDNNLNEVVYDIYCLNRLEAPREALPAVMRLMKDAKTEKRLGDDPTLTTLIRAFLEHCLGEDEGDKIYDGVMDK